MGVSQIQRYARFTEQVCVVNEVVREEIELFINESSDIIGRKLRECGL